MGRGSGGGSRGKRSGGSGKEEQVTIEELNRRISVAETDIIDNANETLLIIDQKTGKVVETHTSESDQNIAAYTNVPSHESYKYVVTHNHPDAAGTFSLTDVVNAGNPVFGANHVVSRDGKGRKVRYSIRVEHATPKYKEIVGREFRKLLNVSSDKSVKATNSGKFPSFTAAERTHRHEAMVKLDKKLRQYDIKLNYKKETF